MTSDPATASASFDAATDATSIAEAMRELGTPERAASERAYLKSTLAHFGTSVPDMRRVVTQYLARHRGIEHDSLVALAVALWAVPVHERRMATVELLVARPKLLSGADLPFIEGLLREAKTWALVDETARKVVGRIVAADPTQLVTLDRWLTDDDFWIRRSAILGLSALLHDGRELDRFFRYADALLGEKEFFIRKAIGWIAREVGRNHPAEVSSWLRRNMERMNGVTIREAVKYIPDGSEILAEWSAQSRRRKSDG